MARLKMSRKKPQRNKQSNTLRIIGGEWRSRKLPFVDALGLRPTPDRVRETLFNWLQGYTHGANCLDLFAGSGILGFESLSRGAKTVTFVEKNKQVSTQLENNISLLSAQATLINTNAISYLSKTQDSYDLIFLDPPYRQGLLKQSLDIICDRNCDQNKTLLNKNALIYLEHESEEIFSWEEFGLTILKQTNAGQVQSYLLRLTNN